MRREKGAREKYPFRKWLKMIQTLKETYLNAALKILRDLKLLLKIAELEKNYENSAYLTKVYATAGNLIVNLKNDYFNLSGLSRRLISENIHLSKIVTILLNWKETKELIHRNKNLTFREKRLKLEKKEF